MSGKSSAAPLGAAAAAAAAFTVLSPEAFVQSPGLAAQASSSSSLRGAVQPASSSSATYSTSFSVPVLGLGAATAASVVASQRRKAKKASAVALRAFENELGVQAPFGYWDPLGFSKDGDVEAFSRRRTTELKNGRVAMLACMGYIVPEYFRWPGFCSPSENISFADIPNGLAAISKVPGAGWCQWFVFIGAVEKGLYPSESQTAPGAYPNAGVLGIPNGSSLPAGPARNKKLNSELANGRLAMMAITGMWFQDGLTGSAWGDWANYVASPLRAFEGELGVQAPVGYFDPLGLSSDGDMATFKRRRETEFKHGRVAMWAAMGYIAPEFFRWPGLLSPSESLKFVDVPNGLKACSMVPGNGWLQVVLFCGAIESYWGYDKYTKGGNPGEYGWKAITSTNPETRKKKLNSELANGRLAMMATMGMFFQDGLTGSAWGDWATYVDSPLRAFENELGVQAPLGFWDPLGFSSDGIVYSFKRRRSVEIKHGRICMLATMGYITPEITGKFPGYLSFSAKLQFADVPNGLAAISKVPFLGWLQVFAYAFFCERSAGYEADHLERTPGDMRWSPPLLATSDPATKTRRLNAEIANGRLAMVATMGMFFQDGLTGSAWGDWSNFTDSILRAFESELGVQAPLGFWDPIGYTADGDVAAFQRRRSVEIKHGRIAMLAAMGYITPEITGRFPGYLAPSMGLKFADVPNGLAAISKVPAAGWAQILAYMSFCEVSQGPGADIKKGRPGDFGFTVLTSSDPEQKTKKLNSEIANGRLAMMATIGMFFQDGLTGSAWGDWALYTSSPLRAFENELGVQAPTGFWDPVGYTKNGDAADFRRRRETEIKHGRVAMFATMGYIAPEYLRFPGYLSPSESLKFADMPNGLGALSKVPPVGLAQIFLFIGLVDFCYLRADPAREPGDFANGGILGVPNASGPIKDAETRKKKLNSEIANGRLAMMAIIGMFFQDGLTGSAWGDWSLFEASPLRAFDASQEPGAVEPLGFWDPVGLTKNKDEEWFKRMRGFELKHGRVAMMAIVGSLGTHFWRFPGCFDVPDGVGALQTMPSSANFGVLFIVAGFFELRILPERETEPGNYGDPFKIVDNKLIGGYDNQWRSFELQNGRLAMFGAIGTIAANAYTGLDAFAQWDEAKPVFIQFLKTTLPYSP